MKIADIAQIQAIPRRFLENILNELKHAGLVASRCGRNGGYFLARSARELTVGQVLRFAQGPILAIGCAGGNSAWQCPFQDDCVFLPMWQRAQEALDGVYDGTTLADLVAQEKQHGIHSAATYTI